MNSIALYAPSDCRRSKKRLLTYEQKHDQLAREVEAKHDHMTRMLAEDLALDLEREFG